MEITLFTITDLIKRHIHDGKQATKLNDGFRDISVSFESGEQATIKLYFPFAVNITKLIGTVTKAIAGTDSATISPSTVKGAVINGTITFPTSSAINTEVTAMPTADYKVGQDSYLQLEMVKTTAGGKAHVQIQYERI